MQCLPPIDSKPPQLEAAWHNGPCLATACQPSYISEGRSVQCCHAALLVQRRCLSAMRTSHHAHIAAAPGRTTQAMRRVHKVLAQRLHVRVAANWHPLPLMPAWCALWCRSLARRCAAYSCPCH